MRLLAANGNCDQGRRHRLQLSSSNEASLYSTGLRISKTLGFYTSPSTTRRFQRRVSNSKVLTTQSGVPAGNACLRFAPNHADGQGTRGERFSPAGFQRLVVRWLYEVPLGIRGRCFVGDVYNAAPFAIRIATPDGHASHVHRHQRPFASGIVITSAPGI